LIAPPGVRREMASMALRHLFKRDGAVSTAVRELVKEFRHRL
jgi:hypothetical protein